LATHNPDHENIHAFVLQYEINRKKLSVIIAENFYSRQQDNECQKHDSFIGGHECDDKVDTRTTLRTGNTSTRSIRSL